MDFVFATIPWVITRHLELRRVEKIGLSVVMSLGMMYALHLPTMNYWNTNMICQSGCRLRSPHCMER